MKPASVALEDGGSLVWDVIILGAGPAGAIAAHQLATAGAQTLLVDKRLFPRRKVCGACLNMPALEALRLAGLESLVAGLGGAPLDTLRIGLSGSSVYLDLPGGVAVSRSRLDLALVNAAVASGVSFLPQTQGVVGTIHRNTRRVMLIQPSRTITASARVVIVATGLGPVRFYDSPVVKSQSMAWSRVGAGCTLDKFPDFYGERTVFMAIGQTGYVGLVQVEDNHLNVAAAVAKSWIGNCGNLGTAMDRILIEAGFAPVPELRQADWQGTIALTRRTWPIAGERLFLLGDATGYIEPFTGEGIAWAMISGQAIAPLVRQGINRWDPALPRAWTSLHRQLIARRQGLCRGMTTLLRHPWLARTAFKLIAQFPQVARGLIQRANITSTHPEPS